VVDWHRDAGTRHPLSPPPLRRGVSTEAYFANLMMPKDAGWWKDLLGPAGNALQHMKRFRVSSPGPSAR